MELIRITAQGCESLSEFYAREADSYRHEGKIWYANLLNLMCNCLEHMATLVAASPVYAVTSHHRLRLVARDDYRSPTLATITPVIDGPNAAALEIAYELPSQQAPWRNAWVRGLALDADQAARMVQIALLRNAHAMSDSSPLLPP